MQSVFPVVSSSKNSKIIIVSTPNGMGNDFYNIWNRATLCYDDNKDVLTKWHYTKVDWYEVPGRDEKWKQTQLESFGGNLKKFNQEYGCCLCGNSIVKLKDIDGTEKEIFIKQLFDTYDSRMKVLTPDGYERFDGVVENEKACCRLHFTDGSNIDCSYDHPFYEDGKMKRVYEMKTGEWLDGNGVRKILKNVEHLGQLKCYDLVNVGKNHTFFVNDLVTHNSFLGSAETLIDSDILKKYKDAFMESHIEPQIIQLHKLFESTKIHIYRPPIAGHSYVIGADPSMGLGSDFQAMSVWDITNTFDIKQVATFYENDVQPKIFAFILVKTALLYGNALIAIENNGVSQVTLTALWQDYEYDNILTEGGNPRTSIGISSSNSRKMDACLNFKLLFEDPMRKIEVNDGRLLGEIEKFEKRNTVAKMPSYEAADGHDDFVMATIWAFFTLKQQIAERYYDVRKSIVNKLGEQQPLFILPFTYEETLDPMQRRMQMQEDIGNLDAKLDMFSSNYDKQIQAMTKDNDSEKIGRDIDVFAKDNELRVFGPPEQETERIISEDDNFTFDMF